MVCACFAVSTLPCCALSRSHLLAELFTDAEVVNRIETAQDLLVFLCETSERKAKQALPPSLSRFNDGRRSFTTECSKSLKSMSTNTKFSPAPDLAMGHRDEGHLCQSLMAYHAGKNHSWKYCGLGCCLLCMATGRSTVAEEHPSHSAGIVQPANVCRYFLPVHNM